MAKHPTLAADYPTSLWGARVVLPKGTRLMLVKNASGTEGDLYAVASISFLQLLTGNKHDPKYRHAFVPTELVSKGD